MRLPVIAVLLTCCGLLVVRPCRAQQPGPPPAPSNNYQRLFPNPTGLNGYEEFVLAADMAKNSPAWQEYESSSSGQAKTLSEKRRILGDPAVKSALAMLREGLKKPVRSPHANADDETLFPELAAFRSLARILNVEIYVLLADGKVGEAIDTLRDTLLFGYRVQTDTLISGLVGIAVDAIAIRPIADHLDQLSARDCDRLIALANDWMDMPDPTPGILAAERNTSMRTLNKYRGTPDKLLKEIFDAGGSESQRSYQEISRTFNENPNVIGPTFDQATALVNAQYDAALADAQRPFWERKDQQPADANSPAAKLAQGLLPNLSQVMERYAREQAQIQLLGIHAAIRRYRWEHEHLPAGLDESKLGRLAIDPFTGQSIAYKRIDDRSYELYSAGPYDRGTADAPPSGQRVPVYVTNRPPRP